MPSRTLYQLFLTMVVAFVGTALAVGQARATHITGGMETDKLWTAPPGRGYLQHDINPVRNRFGHEWTGWLDARSPWISGASRDIANGYDRSDRHVFVETTSLLQADNTTVPSDQAADFNYANKAYIYQAGVMPLHSDIRALKTGENGVPAFAFPINEAKHIEIATAKNRGVPTVDLYYGGMGGGGLVGRTIPLGSNQAGASMMMDNNPHVTFKAFPDTLAHELFHFMGDGDPVHSPNGAHSDDPRNVVAAGSIQWSPGMMMGYNPENSDPPKPNPPVDFVPGIEAMGPTLSPKVGGVDQIVTAQASRIFESNNFSPYLTKNDNPLNGNRVDWNFVVDHGKWTQDEKSFGLEGAPGGADATFNRTTGEGVDSLYFRIPTRGTPTQAPAKTGATGDHLDMNQRGQDNMDMGVFGAVPDFGGDFFRFADVFSLITRYGDSDINPGTGLLDRRTEALDYEIFFVDRAGTLFPGVLDTVFTKGWSDKSNADDFLARWRSPVDAVALYLLARLGNGHDYTTQIDAVIVGVPEPSTLLLAALGLTAVWLRRVAGCRGQSAGAAPAKSPGALPRPPEVTSRASRRCVAC